MRSRANRAGGVLAALAALVVVGCPVDERPLQPLPIVWLPNDGGQSGDGDGDAGNPNPFEAGMHGGGKGGSQAASGRGGTGGSTGGGAGRSDGGNGGLAGVSGIAGTAGKPAPGCEDLDSDDVPDCEETAVKNGSFDMNVAHWTADETIQQSWTQSDANNQLESGSLAVKNVTMEDVDANTISGTWQCVDISETGAYHFVAQLFIPEGQAAGNAGVNLWFYNLPSCEGARIGTGEQYGGKLGVWQLLYANPATPMGACSVAVRLVVGKPFRNPEFNASFDNILFVQD